jgi:putative SOS response-associated peptidase YedK
LPLSDIARRIVILLRSAFNSFSEFNNAEGGDIWFALDESRPLACFAGIWTSFRKVKEGETTNDIFAFLTTEPNAKVGAIHRSQNRQSVLDHPNTHKGHDQPR